MQSSPSLTVPTCSAPRPARQLRRGSDPAGFGAWGHAAHTHADDQFVTAVSGTATIEASEHRFTITTELGTWIPAGVAHSARFDPGFAAFVHRTRVATRVVDEPRAVRVDAALRERLLASAFDGTSPTGALCDVIRSDERHAAGLSTPVLTSPIIRTIDDALRADPAGDHSLEDWARRLHTSATTIRRAFQREFGTSFSSWRTAVRVEASATLLQRGLSVGSAARAVGFSHNGLLAAFHRHYGCAPSNLRSAHSVLDPCDRARTDPAT